MNLAAPKVSILLPAFNAERVVNDALQSVTQQTFQDWEVIAIDDASSDRTYEVLTACGTREPRIQIFRNERNLGMTENWNACLRRASGTFVMKLDADDVLRSRTLELLVTALSGSHVVGAAVRSLICSEDLEPIAGIPGDDAMANGGIDPLRDHDMPCTRWMQIAMMGHQLWSSSAVMTDRAWAVESGGYDERLGCAPDTDFILRLLRQQGSFAHRAYVGVYYRQTNGSVSQLFRQNGWLQWESLAVYLRNLELLPRRSLSRHARQRRSYLWRELDRRQAGGKSAGGPPEEIRTRLEGIFRELHPPPIRDRIVESLHRWAARLPI